MNAALYLRVSTKADKRDDETAPPSKAAGKSITRRRQLRQFCETQGWEIVAEFQDEDSGGKSDRAGFQRMLRAAAQRQFDILVFWARRPAHTRGHPCNPSVLAEARKPRRPLAQPDGSMDRQCRAVPAMQSSGCWRVWQKQERIRIGERTPAPGWSAHG